MVFPDSEYYFLVLTQFKNPIFETNEFLDKFAVLVTLHISPGRAELGRWTFHFPLSSLQDSFALSILDQHFFLFLLTYFLRVLWLMETCALTAKLLCIKKKFDISLRSRQLFRGR